MAVWGLPKVMAIKSEDFKEKGYIYRKDEDGSVALGEESVFSTRARIEVEQSKIDSKYVHLRFSYSNRYMQRTVPWSYAIAAVGRTPQEDTSDPFCTLFEPIRVGVGLGNNEFYFIHVQSGGRLVVDSTSFVFYVDITGSSSLQGHLRPVDLDSLARLPVRANVAFIGSTAHYIKAYLMGNVNHFQLSSNVPHDAYSRHQVSQMPDGHVQLTSIYWNTLWRSSGLWIIGDSNDQTDPDTLFMPFKINATTIALRASNDNFCDRRLFKDMFFNCITPLSPSPTALAQFQVEELVILSRVGNVRYQIEYARVIDEEPYSGWSSTVVNDGEVDLDFAVSFTYQDLKEYTFARSFSLETGVPTVIDAALPFVAKDASVDEAASRINAHLQWNATNTMTTMVTVRGSVQVPAKSSVVASYVGKRATCNVPFYYTETDTINNLSPTPNSVAVSEGVDGLYTATNCYDFELVVEKTQAL
ncbi:hypothetical protein AAHA92_19424 [Salvia divinorum]|uniref:Agglutinin domain-containing protein n=1 Tax=Salvia divinorum TaxID=28513 RepID=A0ABD1H5B3_SALDI